MTTSLIQEIQQGAMKSNMQIDELLRMMKLAAAKLNLAVLESWVEQELDGYTDRTPEYRLVHGLPYAWNPYNGWIPIMTGIEEVMEKLSQAPVRQSIGSLDEMLTGSEEGKFHFPIPQRVVNVMNQGMDFQTSKAIIEISRGDLVSIIGRVRNMILDWSIEMEKQGVLGEGMTFDNSEKEQAKVAMNTFNVGNISNFTGNLGSQNTSGAISASSQCFENLGEAASKIRDAIPQMDLGRNQEELLKKITHSLDEETKKNQPNSTKLKTLVEDGKTILTGAAGNLAAEGALALLLKAWNM